MGRVDPTWERRGMSKVALLENLLRRVEEHNSGYREAYRAREAELDEVREELWREAAERRRLFEEQAREEGVQALAEDESEPISVFMIHTEEAAGKLDRAVSSGAYLVSRVPAQGVGAPMQGSWLILEPPDRRGS
jgi:hypothetical protein